MNVPYPHLRLEQFFDGKVYAWGLFEARFGDLRREFQVEIDGNWDGQRLQLVEHFLYADGERDQRIWQIRPDGADGYVGEAADTVGQARGQCRLNRLNWRYRMRLQTGTRTLKVEFDDAFYLQPGPVLINRAQLHKWGIRLGEVTLMFCPQRLLKQPPFALADDAAEHQAAADADTGAHCPNNPGEH